MASSGSLQDSPRRPLTRTYRQSDLACVRGLLLQLGYDIAEAELTGRITRVLESDDHYLVVAEFDGQVAGILHVFRRPALEKPCEAIIQALVTDVSVRGRGLGKALMHLAEAWASAQGLGSIALHTRKAQAFYEGLGYGRVAASDFMRKTLQGGREP